MKRALTFAALALTSTAFAQQGRAVPGLLDVLNGKLRATATKEKIGDVSVWTWYEKTPASLHAQDSSQFYQNEANRAQWRFQLFGARLPRDAYVAPGKLRLISGTPNTRPGTAVFEIVGGKFSGARLAETTMNSGERTINICSATYTRPAPCKP